jgi:chromate transporter
MNLKPYKEIVVAMARTGVLGYGGGPSVIPLIRYEAVTRYKWLKDEEFGEILALANALPGPIATKMAAYLGYQQKGAIGAFIAVMFHILPTSIAIVALLGMVYALKESAIVAGMIAAVRPVIAVMLGLMAYEFCAKAWKGLGKFLSLGFGGIVFLFLSVVNVHPAIMIVLFLAYGTVHIRLTQWIKQKREKRDHDQERGLPL